MSDIIRSTALRRDVIFWNLDADDADWYNLI